MKKIPLAELLRPAAFDDVVGQEHLTSLNSPFRKMIEEDNFSSFILWGPPGVGKTTIAKIISKNEGLNFYHFSAASSGIPELRRIIKDSKSLLSANKKTVIFIDEIHHFTKTQQDFLLPYTEDGTITLLAATTENPSFQLNAALLSRLSVFILYALPEESIEKILLRAIKRMDQWLTKKVSFTDDGIKTIISLSGKDARIALSILESSAKAISKKSIDKNDIENFVKLTTLKFDKKGEEHYNQISALHKSLRGSDVDAALYWGKRILMAGEDPRYLLRRLIRFAAEDIGLADPNALNLAVSAKESYEFLGSPEGEIGIIELIIYLALSPKSNSVYIAEKNVDAKIKATGYLEVSFHIRNAPTKLMKDIGYGKGYEYSQNFKNAINAQDYLPEKLKGTIFYNPSDRGFEEKLKKRLDYIKKTKKRLKDEKN